jgi:hypothetical protein
MKTLKFKHNRVLSDDIEERLNSEFYESSMWNPRWGSSDMIVRLLNSIITEIKLKYHVKV